MTDQSARAGDPAAASEPEMQTPAPEAPAEAQNDALAAAQQEAAELKDRLLRTLAEMENLRRRTEREVADSRAYGISAFARDMLVVADNMRRALDAIGEDTRAGADPALAGLLDGVELTERELLKALEKHGIRQMEAQGQKFDPNLHQAMFEVPDPSVPAGTVVQVVQSGYMIADRVLRPALVGVSKGGPKAAPGNGEAPVGSTHDKTV